MEMGLTDYAIKSDGNEVNNPRHLINVNCNLRRKLASMMNNKHNLARALGDADWHGFINKLEYKAAEKGVHLVKIDQ
ncbi:hypothetical protein TRECRb50_08130 [Escherichia coli]|nr:hypothetical protein TRECRb50_08130 [Escherichia coli]